MTAISRREFVQGVGAAGLALLAGCGRLPGQTQPASKVPRIGFLSPGSDRDLEVFRQGLWELGHVEGGTIAVEPRWAMGRNERLPELAAELVQMEADIIVAVSTPAAQAAQQATTRIPIVFISVTDPVGQGIVSSLARPGGNATGLSYRAAGLAGKRLELLKEAVPRASLVAVLWNSSNPGNDYGWREMRDAAPSLGLELRSLEVREATDLDGAFEAAAWEHAHAFTVLPDALLGIHRARIVTFAAQSRLPAMYTARDDAEAGGLLAYGPSFAAQTRRAAYYVDRILKGAKPADLPVEQPREFEFIINLQTAHALGLTIPQHVLLQATEVLQ